MQISKVKIMKGCGKTIPMILKECGSWSLKHNEYYYCSECWENREQSKGSKNE